MPSIFIDANIILGFWSLGDGRVPADLLLPLVDLRDDVLITQQIADEVNRNKLGVFLRNSTAAVTVGAPQEFPDHMMKVREVAAFNKELKEFKKKGADLKKHWTEIKAKIAAEISMSKDLPSQMLSPLLDTAKAASSAQLGAARDRRERGNPPGKKADPLGDQVSWQQFLDAVKGQETVWIISRDGDFAEILDKVRVINPFLRKELLERGVKTIHVFDTLAAAIAALKAAGIGKAEKLDDDKLAALAKEEVQARMSHLPYPFPSWSDGEWTCPSCGQVNSSRALVARPSSYGGWSYWATCSRCGYQHDTHEPYDD